ncbi:hypothetical protein AB1Y20_004017 [Prymnesium parvum]|uniref:Phospholipase B-like n=1 Tax=Prymnesium parvum TaxID=97485 RepID=A0AB34J8E3_PRYPA
MGSPHLQKCAALWLYLTATHPVAHAACGRICYTGGCARDHCCSWDDCCDCAECDSSQCPAGLARPPPPPPPPPPLPSPPLPSPPQSPWTEPAAAPRCATDATPLPSVPREIVSEPNEGGEPLVRQTLRPISRSESEEARARRVPFEPPPTLDDARLAWEYDETLTFTAKQLKKDPRLRPSDIEVSTDHMRACKACENARGLRAALHAAETLEVGVRMQLLLDDWAIARWQNIVRFLNPPDDVRVALDGVDDRKFGCPCSALPTADGGVQLYYSAGSRRGDDLTNRYAFRTSANGYDGWSEERAVRVEREAFLGTFTVAGTPSLPGEAPPHANLTYLAGYEGWRGRACLASSSDGADFWTIGSSDDMSSGGDCFPSSKSYLSRAADAYVTAVVDAAARRELVWYRKDFGTVEGWREIRGVQCVELSARLADVPHSAAATRVATRHAEWYLDRLGKLERYRRQIYSLTLTPYDEGLWLGLMSVIEFAKDLSEPAGHELPPFERDTINTYLVTSRDGVHVDDEWVYAHRPLLPKAGLTQRHWRAGLTFASAQLMTRRREHRVYFEARPGDGHHETRFASRAKIGTAAWARDQLGGLRAAHADAAGVVTTKPFRRRAAGLRLVVDTLAACSNLTVEVLAATGGVVEGRGLAEAVPVAGRAGRAACRRW